MAHPESAEIVLRELVNRVTKRIEKIKIKHRKQSLDIDSRIQSDFQNQNRTLSTGKTT